MDRVRQLKEIAKEIGDSVSLLENHHVAKAVLKLERLRIHLEQEVEELRKPVKGE